MSYREQYGNGNGFSNVQISGMGMGRTPRTSLVGMLPAAENGQCTAEPPLRTGPLSSHVIVSADECAHCR